MMREKKYWAVIPAAGVGRRMQADRPKQYLPLGAGTVLEQTIAIFSHHPRIAGIVVIVTEGDPYWAQLTIDSARPLYVAAGGVERCHSVLNGLALLQHHAAPDDWVLVHDAARPCLRQGDIDLLIDALEGDEVGGLLAIPVRDTMKRDDGTGRIARTEERRGMWHALTPQMFPLGLLREALAQALADGFEVTDEASALEHSGRRPRLVEGHADNIKITRPEDLALARFFLQQLPG
ncbi:MAG: 2-C-methyl-D-erythritol 4-phosphate cytidylyltransferase [Gammaproteobacteria bacterium]|nr:2-C-methyl-D-erythritol 4-phosphate cytidylyltransferase [Gammaproteobacteria bacterium]